MPFFKEVPCERCTTLIRVLFPTNVAPQQAVRCPNCQYCLTSQEQAQLISYLEVVAGYLETESRAIEQIEHVYPGLVTEQMFCDLKTAVATAIEKARSLADYVAVATDEPWKKRGTL